MKRLLFILILAFVGVTNASAAYSEMAVRDTSDIDLRGGNFPWGGGDRSLIINELRACIVSFGDMVYVLVTVTQNLGQVEFTITNSSTGEYLDGEFNALPGSYPIPISGSPGFYTITFILPDGRSCYGTFEL